VLVDSFIDEDDLIGIKRGLIFAPDLLLQRDVGAKLLAGVKRFLKLIPCEA
jgi:hypothetical protein